MNRIEKLQKQLIKQTLAGFIVEDSIDLFYLLGQSLSAGTLLVTPSDATLFVDGRYFQVCSEKVDCTVCLISNEALKTWFVQSQLSGKVGFDGKKMSFDRTGFFRKLFIKLQDETLTLDLISIENPIIHLRSCKEKEEVQKLQASCTLLEEGFSYIESLFCEGITEKELAFELETFLRKKGACKLSFDPIIAFGKNSAYPHYRSGDTKLCKNELILIDAGCFLDSYASDMTKMYFFGEVDSKLKEIVSIVRGAFDKALQSCKVGMSFHELDKVARDFIEGHGYGKAFLHSLGHGVGLEVHEYPRLAKNQKKGVITTGMVFTLEPGIYLENLGGARHEEMIYMSENGPISFSKKT